MVDPDGLIQLAADVARKALADSRTTTRPHPPPRKGTTMPRICTICQHPSRAAIDTALVRDGANRRIAAQYAVTEQAIRRHKAEHLPGAMVKAQEQEDVRSAIDIVQQLKAINGVCWQVLQDARGQRRRAGAQSKRSCPEAY